MNNQYRREGKRGKKGERGGRGGKGEGGGRTYMYTENRKEAAKGIIQRLKMFPRKSG